jgi:STE24 endopeptidase
MGSWRENDEGQRGAGGLGATRRILVSDTMLAEFSDDEIEVVLAHEIAHHVHGDIWKGIAFESALIVAGFYLASQVLRTMALPVGLRGVDDVAGLPLLLLAAGAVSLVMVPAAHAMSRASSAAPIGSRWRSRGIRTRSSRPCAGSARRTSPRNILPKIVQWLFYSHPPVASASAAARPFKH